MIDLSKFLHPLSREIYRDEHLFVINKPTGVVSHPNPPQQSSPHAILNAPYDTKREGFLLDKNSALYLVHRLDKETSGLLLLCFNSKSAEVMRKAIGAREVQKNYSALLVGVPTPIEGEWTHRLEKSAGESKVRVVRGAPNAVSQYRVVESFKPPGLALAVLSPETGRTHQLRVQSAKRGYPIAGDRQYGNFAANRELIKKLKLNRMFLHAAELTFKHPITGKLIQVEAPLPNELSAVVDKLRKMTQKK